jgi:hypothetical protein
MWLFLDLGCVDEFSFGQCVFSRFILWNMEGANGFCLSNVPLGGSNKWEMAVTLETSHAKAFK